MPTLTAVTKNPAVKPFYERLRAKGKPPRVALIASMRKPLTVVDAAANQGRPFEVRTETARLEQPVSQASPASTRVTRAATSSATSTGWVSWRKCFAGTLENASVPTIRRTSSPCTSIRSPGSRSPHSAWMG